jgi:hypothetical protein
VSADDDVLETEVDLRLKVMRALRAEEIAQRRLIKERIRQERIASTGRRVSSIGFWFHRVVANLIFSLAYLSSIVLSALRLDSSITIPWSVVLAPVFFTNFSWILGCIHSGISRKLNVNDSDWKVSPSFLMFAEMHYHAQRFFVFTIFPCAVAFEILLVLRLDALSTQLPWLAVYSPVWLALSLGILASISGCGYLSLKSDHGAGRLIRIGVIFALCGLLTSTVLVPLKLDEYVAFSWCVSSHRRPCSGCLAKPKPQAMVLPAHVYRGWRFAFCAFGGTSP